MSHVSLKAEEAVVSKVYLYGWNIFGKYCRKRFSCFSRRTQRKHESLSKRQAMVSPEAARPVCSNWTTGAELTYAAQSNSNFGVAND